MRTSRPCIPVCPILESSQPQFSKSPILQFLVSVYMTPAALMACTKDVSLVAVRSVKECEHQCYIQPRFLIHSCSISVQRGHYSSVRKLRVKSLRVKTATVSLNHSQDPFPSHCCYLIYVTSCMSYLFEGHCVWITGACSLGSSISPTRTGACTLVFHSARPFARC